MADASGDLRMGVACSAFVVIGAVEAALGVLVPSLLDTFALSTGSVTLLLASQIGGYLLAALLNGVLNGRLGLDRLLVVAFTLLASALLLYALTPRWDLMVATGVAVGLGIGLIDAGLNTAVAQHAAGARLIGPLHGFYGVGVSLYWLGLTAGRFGFGGLVGRLGAIRWIACSLALLLAALIGWSGGAAPWLALPLAGFGLAGIFPATILLIPRRLPVALVPAAVGLATSAASAGAVAVPTSLGWIAAEMGLAAVPALLLPVVLGLAGLHVLLLPRHG